MKVKINIDQYRKSVLDPIGIYYKDKLLKEYVNDFDNKSNGRIGFGGISWKPLALSTINQKRKLNVKNPTKILRRFDKLRSGIKVIYSKNTATIKIFIDPSINYAKYHNTGGGKLPKRQLLGEPPQKIINEIRSDIDKTTKNFIGDMFRQLKDKNIDVTGFYF